jgi:6-phosphogluconolactonase
MKPQMRVFEDLEALSRGAAVRVIEAAGLALRERGRFLLALNGGNTPARLFQLLGVEAREAIDWEHTQVYWGDERCVPPDHPESSYGQAQRALLSHVSIPVDNIHRIKGELGAEAASRDYAETLKRQADPGTDWPKFDLVLLGLGEDGHTASLFPGSDPFVTQPTLPVTARYQDRPAERVTLTPPVINSARLILFMVSGESKAAALLKVLSGPFEPGPLPAQRIDPKGGRVIWLVDAAAASQLPGSLLKSRKVCEG